MPYNSISELPDSVRDNLPKHAQEIYKEAFNSAWDHYADPESGATMPRARRPRTAWPGRCERPVRERSGRHVEAQVTRSQSQVVR